MVIVICDDDRAWNLRLYEWVTQYFNCHRLEIPQVHIYTNGEQLLGEEYYVDIAFLEVEISGRSGIYIGKELYKRNPSVLLFIQSIDDCYLDEALRAHAFRYFTKPFTKKRLYDNLSDALYEISKDDSKYVLRTMSGILMFYLRDIVYFETDRHKVYVHTKHGIFSIQKNICELEVELCHRNFYRTHRCYLVNLCHVERTDGYFLHMDDGSCVYLSRRRSREFYRALRMSLNNYK